MPYFRYKPYTLLRDFDPQYCENKYILKWWTDKHDKLLLKLIKKHLWYWHFFATKEIIKITPDKIIESWREEDQLCHQFAWYNILTNFAGSRAEKIGLTNSIREPTMIKCPLCQKPFLENSLPTDLVQRLGANQIDVCGNCFRSVVNFQGKEGRSISKNDVISYIQDLTIVIERIPPKNFGEGYNDFLDLSTKSRIEVFEILKRKVRPSQVNKLFGSWFHALVESGILNEDSQRMVIGTRCLAADGHLCFSLGEKTIDDFLYYNKISHEKEPKYPDSNYKADFMVEDTFIEYFGLIGYKNYDKKIQLKRDICKKNKIKLIELYPNDIISNKKLKEKLNQFIKSTKSMQNRDQA